MVGYESQLKIKELFVLVAEQEIAIEKLRQILAAMRDFEPYTAFRRIDRKNTGLVSAKSLCQFLRENGYRDVQTQDFEHMIRYFDLDGDKRLNYHDFLQVLLPCDDSFLRAAATQRPNTRMTHDEFLPQRVERALSQLLYKELRLHLKGEMIKRTLESAYDFSYKKAFQVIDDWNYSYIDMQNLKRFLRNTGHIANK